jgi:hypothetical protein
MQGKRRLEWVCGFWETGILPLCRCNDARVQKRPLCCSKRVAVQDAGGCRRLAERVSGLRPACTRACATASAPSGTRGCGRAGRQVHRTNGQQINADGNRSTEQQKISAALLSTAGKHCCLPEQLPVDPPAVLGLLAARALPQAHCLPAAAVALAAPVPSDLIA